MVVLRDYDQHLCFHCGCCASHGAFHGEGHIERHHRFALPDFVISIRAAGCFRCLRDLFQDLLAAIRTVIVFRRGQEQLAELVFGRAGRVLLVVSTVPGRIRLDGIDLGLPEQKIVGRQPWRTALSMKPGYAVIH